MTGMTKKMVFGSMIASGLVALLAVLDLVLGIPFAGQMVMDIMFLIAAALIAYMGYETYKELA